MCSVWEIRQGELRPNYVSIVPLILANNYKITGLEQNKNTQNFTMKFVKMHILN